MDSLYRLKELLDKEINKVTAKGEISPTEVKPLGEIIDIYKDIETICAMKEYGQEDDMYSMENRGYSTRRYYNNSYDDMSYARRGRNSRDNYSRRAKKEEMIGKLERMLDNPNKTEMERREIMECIDDLKYE